MKSVTYIGGCSTICEFGQKFTLQRRTVLLSDEDVKPFLNNPCYSVVDVPKEKILNPDSNEGDKKDNINKEKEEDINEEKEEDINEEILAKKKKLMNLSAEQLKIMCEDKGLDSNGTKDVLSDRILGL